MTKYSKRNKETRLINTKKTLVCDVTNQLSSGSLHTHPTGTSFPDLTPVAMSWTSLTVITA